MRKRTFKAYKRPTDMGNPFGSTIGIFILANGKPDTVGTTHFELPKIKTLSAANRAAEIANFYVPPIENAFRLAERLEVMQCKAVQSVRD